MTIILRSASAAGNVQLVGYNTIADVDPDPSRLATYTGTDGVAGVLAYGGMAFAPNYGASGALLIAGGGHADYGGNEAYLFDLATYTWTRISNPSTAMPPEAGANPDPRLWSPPADPLVHGEYSDGTPMSFHSYNSLIVVPGGTNNKGQFLSVARNALNWSAASYASGWTHSLDLGVSTPAAWARFSTNSGYQRPSDNFGSWVCCYDASRDRVWGVAPGAAFIDYLDLTTNAHTSVACATGSGTNPCAAAVPVNDLMLIASQGGAYGSDGPLQIVAIQLSNPGAGATTLTLTGEVPQQTALPAWGFDWDTDRGVGYAYMGNWTFGAGPPVENDLLHVWKITPPSSSPLTNPWIASRITLLQSLPANNSDGVWSRWRYCSTIKKFAYVPTTTGQVVLWTPG